MVSGAGEALLHWNFGSIFLRYVNYLDRRLSFVLDVLLDVLLDAFWLLETDRSPLGTLLQEFKTTMMPAR